VGGGCLATLRIDSNFDVLRCHVLQSHGKEVCATSPSQGPSLWVTNISNYSTGTCRIGRMQEASHRCWHPNQPRSRGGDGGFCRNPVANDRGYRFCGQARHRDGPLEFFWQLTHGFPSHHGLSYKSRPKESENIAQPQGPRVSLSTLGTMTQFLTIRLRSRSSSPKNGR